MILIINILLNKIILSLKNIVQTTKTVAKIYSRGLQIKLISNFSTISYSIINTYANKVSTVGAVLGLKQNMSTIIKRQTYENRDNITKITMFYTNLTYAVVKNEMYIKRKNITE